MIQKEANSAEIIVPFAVGDDIRKYQIRDKNRYLLLMKIGVDIERYSAVFEYLKQYQEKLEKRWDKGENWWELRACAYYEDFENSKIIYPVIAKESRFTLSDETTYTNDKTFIIPKRDLFLLAFLNSNVAWFYLKNICSVLGDADKGGRLELRSIHVQTLPIPKIEEKDQQPFVALVDQILELKKTGEDTQALEDEIDALVYRLYDLTDEEIKIVEGKA